ncbi:MAG TPA: phage holin family protein [Candidatus Binatia bacterium]|jgi:hypothetical protein
MATDVQRVPKPTLLALVRGIIEDAKQLAIGQYEYRRYQTLRQITKTKAFALWLGTGITLAAIGLILITLMVVHLLHDFFNLTFWASYGIVGIVLLAVAGACLYVARTRI